MRRAREGRDKGTLNDTTMPQDLHGLTLTCASAEAADAFNRAALGYIKYRLDTPSISPPRSPPIRTSRWRSA